MEDRIVKLGEPECIDMGGKAANLSRLIRLGFNVPEGHVVGPSVDLKTVGAPDGRFAIRSSAVGEDGHHSFAGVFSSFVNVDAKHVASYVRHVRESLRSDQVDRYCASVGATHPTDMHVIVQRYIYPVLSGVTLTDHPTDPRDMIITWGKGQAAATDGLRKVSTFSYRSQDDSIAASVPAPRILIRQVPIWKKIRHLFGPSDIEWVIDHDGWAHITQVRAIPFTRKESKFTSPTWLPIGQGQPVGGWFELEGLVVKTTLDQARKRPWSGDEILVLSDPTPDWDDMLGRVAAVVTAQGCLTSHVALRARELGLPAVVGADVATQRLNDGDIAAVCSNGFVYRRELNNG